MATPNYITTPGVTLPSTLILVSIPPSTLTYMGDFLLSQGRCKHQDLGDGNCLFSSLSHQLNGTVEYYSQLWTCTTDREERFNIPKVLDQKNGLGECYIWWPHATSQKQWKLGYPTWTASIQGLFLSSYLCVAQRAHQELFNGKRKPFHGMSRIIRSARKSWCQRVLLHGIGWKDSFPFTIQIRAFTRILFSLIWILNQLKCRYKL